MTHTLICPLCRVNHTEWVKEFEWLPISDTPNEVYRQRHWNPYINQRMASLFRLNLSEIEYAMEYYRITCAYDDGREYDMDDLIDDTLNDEGRLLDVE